MAVCVGFGFLLWVGKGGALWWVVVGLLWDLLLVVLGLKICLFDL